MKQYIMHLKTSAAETIHPMLLPMIILNEQIGVPAEKSQYDARSQIRKIEMRLKQQVSLGQPDGKELDAINSDLANCPSIVWKDPRAYLEIIVNFKRALEVFDTMVLGDSASSAVKVLGKKMRSRLDLSHQRVRGIESYSRTTLRRIDIQRTILHNFLLNRHTSITLQIEERQQLEAHRKFTANQSLSRSQLSLTFLGTFFLPGAFLAVSVTLGEIQINV